MVPSRQAYEFAGLIRASEISSSERVWLAGMVLGQALRDGLEFPMSVEQEQITQARDHIRAALDPPFTHA